MAVRDAYRAQEWAMLIAKHQEKPQSNPLPGMGIGRQQERMGTLKKTNILPVREQRKEYRYGYSSCKRNH